MSSAKCTVLLLDDEPLILMDLEFAAEDHDCMALSATNVREALDHLDGMPTPDCAVLDVTLRDGETCVPVARALEQRGIPYVLHSGDLNRQEGTLATLSAKLIAKPACSQMVIGAALELSGATNWRSTPS